MNRKAVIDIGSNSIKLFVCEMLEDGSLLTVHDENEVVRLGERLQENGMICPEAMERGVAAVSRFALKAEELCGEKPASVGTMTLRSARNSEEFLERVKAACDIDVKIIPGEEEARLSYLAVRSSLTFGPDENIVVFDTGGGSTEFIYGAGSAVTKRFSVNLGSVYLTERFFSDDPVTIGSVEKAEAYIEGVLSSAGVSGHPNTLVGIGGNVTSLGAVSKKLSRYDRDAIQGSTLTLSEVESQIAQLSSMTLDQRRELPGLAPKRADIILSGACIIKVIIQRLQVKELTICDKGLRYGLALELFRKE